MLVNACVTHCRKHGINRLYLYTPDKQALYARMVWQSVEQHSDCGRKCHRYVFVAQKVTTSWRPM
ncbi:MAG: hypothetical protein ACSLEM_04590 [Candidatus Malihini olakiniferum]